MDAPEIDNAPPAGQLGVLALDALLAAFEEHEKWLEAEIEAMGKDRSRYVEADHHGLPYARDVLKMIRKQATVYPANGKTEP